MTKYPERKNYYCMTENKKRGRGRPRLSVSVRMNHILQVRMNTEDLAIVESAATKSGKQISDWIRDILLAEARKPHYL